MSVVGVDVGGTKTLVGLFGDRGLVASEQLVTRTGGDDVARVASAVVDVVTRWRDGYPALVDGLTGVGMGFPEYVSPDGRLTSTEVLTWSDQPAEVMATALAGAGLTRAKVVVDSDVRLGALGEARHGAGRSYSSFVYVTVGTGVSGCLVIDGEPWRGARGEAIGVGELPTDDGSTLERRSSGAAVERRYGELTGLRRTTREIAALVADDAGARALLDDAGSSLGRACAALVAVLDPEAVIVGGGLGVAPTALAESLRRTYESAVGRRPAPPPLLPAATGALAGLYGAAQVAPR